MSSIRGAILAAALYVAVPQITDQDVQSAVGLFGLGALFLGRLPGGVIGQLERLPSVVGSWLGRGWAEVRATEAATAAPRVLPEPSDFARRVLAERERTEPA